MKKLSLLHAIPLSLFSRQLYREVAVKWDGLGFTYIFVTLALLLIPAAIILANSLNATFSQDPTTESQELIALIDQIPTFTYQHGALSSDVEQPYTIYTADTSEPLIIIDTTGTTPSLEGTTAPMLIKKREVLFREGGQTKTVTIQDFTSVLDIDHAHEIVIDRTMLDEWLSMAREKSSSVPLIMYVSTLSVMFIGFAFRALVFGLIGTMIAQFMKIRLPYKILTRLAAVSSTPIIILEVLPSYIGFDIFSWKEIVYLVLHAGYLYFAIESLKMAAKS